MSGLVLDRARSVLANHPFPRQPPERDITLFIAGHGTPRNPQSREAIERQADLVRAENWYAAVHAVFMEEQPRIGDCLSMATTRYVVVVPFFLGDGMHVCEDIPILLGEPGHLVKSRLAEGRPTWRNPAEKQGKLVWYARAVGTEPSLAEVILDRVREAAAWNPPHAGE
jgi:sirohydrochlorin cobaltochelatase